MASSAALTGPFYDWFVFVFAGALIPSLTHEALYLAEEKYLRFPIKAF